MVRHFFIPRFISFTTSKDLSISERRGIIPRFSGIPCYRYFETRYKKTFLMGIILFCSLMSLQTAEAARPLRYGKLLFTLGTRTSSPKRVVELLKINEEKLFKTLENVCAQPFIVYSTKRTEEGKSVSEASFDQIELILDHAKAELIDGNKTAPVTIPGKGNVFLVAIPYILKNSPYDVVNGKVVIRTDGKKYQKLIQPAEIRIFVAQNGKVYW